MEKTKTIKPKKERNRKLNIHRPKTDNSSNTMKERNRKCDEETPNSIITD